MTKHSATRPSDYCSHACQQRAYRLRKELGELAEMHQAFEAVQEQVAALGMEHPLSMAWLKFVHRAQRHSNVFRQMTRGRLWTMAADDAGSQAQEPDTSLHAQGGHRIGENGAAALGEGKG